MPEAYEEISIKDGSPGLITYPSAADIPAGAMQVMKNVQVVRPGLWTALPGAGTAQLRIGSTLTNIPALPSGFTLEKAFVFHIASPSDTDVIVVFGSKSGRDRFYVWPDINQSGSIVSSGGGSRVSGASIHWLELTEAVATTVSSVSVTGSTGDTFIVASVSDLDTSLADYYKHWYVLVWDSLGITYRGASYIKAYNATTREIQTNYGGFGIIATDIVVLMRFPVFKKTPTVTAYYQIDDLPFFAQHSESVIIHTGTHAINNGPDLWLGYIDRTYFGSASGASNLTFKGWHFDHAQPWRLIAENLTMSLTSSSGSSDPLPYTGPATDYWVFQATALYDGVNESRVVIYTKDGLPVNRGIGIPDADDEIGLTFGVDIMADGSRASEYATAPTTDLPILSRRISEFRIYMAKAVLATAIGPKHRPKGSFYLIKTFTMADTGWALSGTEYRKSSVAIQGSDWAAGQAFSFDSVNGHSDSQTGANAKFETQVAGRVFVAPVYDDTKKNFRSLFTPLRQSGETGDTVLPVTNRIDVNQHDVYEITGLAGLFGRLVVFGRHQLLVATVSGSNQGQIDEQFQKTGCVSYRSIRVANGLLWFSSYENILEAFDGNAIRVPAPGFAIKDIWDGFTVAEKQSAFVGYHKINRELWVAVGNTQRILVYDLTLDSWKEYDSDNAYIDFMEGENGELFGITSSTIYEMRSASSTESLAITLRSHVFNHTPRHYRRLRMVYKSTSTVVAKVYDEEIGATALGLGDEAVFVSQTTPEAQDAEISLSAERFSFEITRAASTDTTFQIDEFTVAGVTKPEH